MSAERALDRVTAAYGGTASFTKKVFQNDGSRRQQRIEQASVRKARWISGSRS
jgi:hypothetical protein